MLDLILLEHGRWVAAVSGINWQNEQLAASNFNSKIKISSIFDLSNLKYHLYVVPWLKGEAISDLILSLVLWWASYEIPLDPKLSVAWLLTYLSWLSSESQLVISQYSLCPASSGISLWVKKLNGLRNLVLFCCLYKENYRSLCGDWPGISLAYFIHSWILLKLGDGHMWIITLFPLLLSYLTFSM